MGTQQLRPGDVRLARVVKFWPAFPAKRPQRGHREFLGESASVNWTAS